MMKSGVAVGGEQQAPAYQRKEEPIIVGRIEQADDDQERIHRDIDEEMIARSDLADHQEVDDEVDEKSPHGAILTHGVNSLSLGRPWPSRTHNLEPAAGLWPSAIAQTKDIGGEIGKLGLGKGNGRHGMFRQHDARDNGACGLSLLICDLLKARNVGIGMLLLGTAHEMAIGAELLRQNFTVPRVRLRGYPGKSERHQKKQQKNREHRTLHGGLLLA